MGVRMGSSEIYAIVEDLPEVVDSLVVGLELSGGQYLMPLFVVLAEGLKLDNALKTKTTCRTRYMPSLTFPEP
jgi:acetoacetyl-CoA synthetase